MALETLHAFAKLLTKEELPELHRKRASVALIFRIIPNANIQNVNANTHDLKVNTQVISPEAQNYFKSILDDYPHNLSGNLQVLFIKRAVNTKDLHSGQIAFPGGKLDPGETSSQAAIRETFEEIGVDLTKNFFYLGRNEEVNVYKNFRIKILYVTCHRKIYSVFFQLDNTVLQIKLNEKEVEKIFWVDFDYFTHKTQSVKSSVKFVIQTIPIFKFSGRFSCLRLPQLEKNVFFGVSLDLMKKLIFSLPPTLRTCSLKDWVYIRFDFPFCILGYIYHLIASYSANPRFKLVFFLYHGTVLIIPLVLYKSLKPKL